MKINEYRKNIFSQNGEDGVIEYILERLPSKNGWCCEFGAWDGKYLSNTYNLVKSENYKAVYIEGDSNKFRDLLTTCQEHSGIVPIQRLVGHEGENSLDNILSSTEIPKDFDLLSIDVDGIDYLIWKNLEIYRPKVVVIEINSYMRPNYSMSEHQLSYPVISSVHALESGGVNFKTCYELGLKKGYKLLIHLGNMIFVDEKYEDLFDVVANEDNYMDFFDNSWQGQR